MKANSGFAQKITGDQFIVTAEYLPKATTDTSAAKKVVEQFGGPVAAINVADNPYGVGMSSLAGAVAIKNAGGEPIYQIVTRDRNRMAIQSDLLGAASLGIGNILCLSGYHQILTDCPESANVYDIDSVQLLALVDRMTEQGQLLDGKSIDGDFAMLPGGAANPYLQPQELNMIRLAKKVQAGAKFIQTQAVFNTDNFAQWLDIADKQGITGKTAILAGVLVLDSAEEAEKLRSTFTDFVIGDDIVDRLKQAGDADAQAKEGVAICAEVIKKLKPMKGLRGVHLISGGNEALVPQILTAAGL